MSVTPETFALCHLPSNHVEGVTTSMNTIVANVSLPANSQFIGTFVDPALSYADPFVQRFTDLILSERSQRGFIKLTVAVFLGIGLVGASILAYAAFYHSYIPSLAYNRALYLDYR